ncbi:hypothetical protein THUN1379_06090 [Paludibacterium sp. THUN1379]|uniref:hypothetical protein n=1 Tax=Paludibacterium sp. THUN1379 TaxID=3112107 RepID=UPI00308EE774|nr:hypothetical protein THUN1379_06090 [Paludibacterium sp. THUN1379]
MRTLFATPLRLIQLGALALTLSAAAYADPSLGLNRSPCLAAMEQVSRDMSRQLDQIETDLALQPWQHQPWRRFAADALTVAQPLDAPVAGASPAVLQQYRIDCARKMQLRLDLSGQSARALWTVLTSVQRARFETLMQKGMMDQATSARSALSV